MSGIRRQLGTEPRRQAKPLELEPLARVVEPIELTTLAAYRDRALLLLGFAAALRRSELVALDVEDLDFDPAKGVLLTIRRSKTDQEQAGAPSRCRTRPRQTSYARSAHSLPGSRLPGSTAGPCFGRCAAATHSPTSGSQTSRSR
jgi:integrase